MIKIENLSYGYTKSRKILRGISLEIGRGHTYGLLGKNGVGKSTLLKLVCGLLQGEGEIRVNGIDPKERDVEMLRQIRLVGENEAMPNLKPMEWAKIVAPFYPNFDFGLFQKALSDFEVPAGQSLTQMSLGQQKKSVISLALACRTACVILDEPTNGMDIPSKAIFRRLVAEATNEQTTVIISTHQVDDIESILDAVIILENTGVLLNDTIENIGRKYRFGVAKEGEKVLYSEPTLHGVISMMENETGEESPVDLKILFTAITRKQDA